MTAARSLTNVQLRADYGLASPSGEGGLWHPPAPSAFDCLLKTRLSQEFGEVECGFHD